jgi:uncharacterized protein
MKLPVSQMKEGENAFSYDSAKEAWLSQIVNSAGEDSGMAVEGPLQASFNFTKLEPDYFLRGDFRFVLKQPCSRCAETVTTPIDHHFELALSHQPGPRPSANQKPNEESEESDLIIFHGPELELDSIVREQLHLSFPYKTLCRPDCKGICQKCGKNLNEGLCGCESTNDLSPFSVLKELKGGTRGST